MGMEIGKSVCSVNRIGCPLYDGGCESIDLFLYVEAVAWRCSLKKLLLKISQNLQENTCARVFFLKRKQGSGVIISTLIFPDYYFFFFFFLCG